MPRKSRARALVPVTPVSTHRFGRKDVADVAIYHVPDRHPREPGPWQDEFDKAAWWDWETGLGCIIRREIAGCLGGYVGIPKTHPLFRFDWKVIPAGLDITVHGGLSYAEPCRDDEPEAVSICHVLVPIPALDAVSGDRLEAHAPIWWLGFQCNESYDFVPGRGDDDVRRDDTQVYRDEAYVYRQVIQLAAQLHAIGEGLPKPVLTDQPPPRGLDPSASRSE